MKCRCSTLWSELIASGKTTSNESLNYSSAYIWIYQGHDWEQYEETWYLVLYIKKCFSSEIISPEGILEVFPGVCSRGNETTDDIIRLVETQISTLTKAYIYLACHHQEEEKYAPTRKLRETSPLGGWEKRHHSEAATEDITRTLTEA